jgi:hypothetical protein
MRQRAFLYVERPPSRLQIDYSHVKVKYGTVTIHLICGTSPESIDPGFNGTESGFNIGKYPLARQDSSSSLQRAITHCHAQFK